MPTNKITLRTVEDFMADYVPVYQPLYPLFLDAKSQQHAAEVGKNDFRRVTAVGDIRAKHITPKDTEIRQIAVMDGKKTFRKYFLANQYIHSEIQDREGVEEVQKQVLDEHQIQMDELFLLGDGTSPSDVLNNGLFYSGDSNYLLESSYEIPTSNRLAMFLAKILSELQKAAQVAGRKVIVFYGSDVITLLNSIMPNSDRIFRTALLEAIQQYNASITVIPDAATPANANGFIIANMDQVKTHYTLLPELINQGNNEEKMYLWSNFMMGSLMLEVMAKNAVIRQPTTLEV